MSPPHSPHPQSISVMPLKFKLGVDFNVRNKSLSYHAHCKEVLLGGTLRLDTDSEELVYRKDLPLRTGDVSTPFTACLEASVAYKPLLGGQLDALRPRVTLGVHSGMGNATMVKNSFDIRQRVRVTKAVQAEVCANLELPLPDSEIRWDASRPEGALAVGAGDLHLHVGQVNAVFKF